MPNSRSINNTLDSPNSDSSAHIPWSANSINELFNLIQFFQNISPGSFTDTARGWICMERHGDNTFITPPAYIGIFNLQHYPETSGTENSPPTSNPAPSSNPFEIGQWAQSFSDTGLRHRAQQAQFMKGVSDSFGQPSTFEASGGSNLASVEGQQGTYVTSNIKFSDFRGFKKTGDGGVGDYNDGQDEELHTTGKIQLGTHGQASQGN